MIKAKDLVILSKLRNNGRAKLTALSKTTSLPISTIYERIRQHQGVFIRKHCALLNFEKLGFQTRAHILFKVHKDEKAAFAESIKKDPALNSFYRINNGYDFLAECVFKNIHEVETFLENIEEKHRIKATEVHYIVEDLEREIFLSDADTAKKLL